MRGLCAASLVILVGASVHAEPRRLRPASNRGFDDPKGLGAPPSDGKIQKILARFSDRETRLVALPPRRDGLARASSEVRPRARAARAIDHNPRTAWSEDEPGVGVGAWLELEVETRPGQRVFGVVLGSGFAGTERRYQRDPRPRTVYADLVCRGGHSARYLLDLADTRRPQLFVFGPNERVEVGSPCRLRLTIQSVFPGRSSRSLAISEVRLVVAESPR
ncbi:MAG: hypothetical protein AAF654_06520 [Myxococcota bacterium]